MKSATLPVRVVIITPVAVERRAVVRHLRDHRSDILEGDLYEAGLFTGKYGEYKVVVQETGPKTVNLALATEKAIRLFQPAIVLLVGIAGGVKDASIGDIVVGTKAYGYESGKETADGAVSRPDVLPYSRELVAVARAISHDHGWQQRVEGGAAGSRVFFGPIASGDKVIATTDSPVYRHLKQHYNDTLALEMESIGFAQAAFRHRNVHALNIRAISDLLDHKSGPDENARQETAAGRAAGFAFEMLYQLDPSTFAAPPMEIKDLVQQLYTLLFPAALNEIKKDFADATNNEIREIWKKVKPLFIKEVEELAKEPEDADAQAGVRNALRKKLEGDQGLKEELEKLLEGAKGQGGAVSVVNSKNVVAGSGNTAGRDFRIGDKVVVQQNGWGEKVGRDKVEIHHHYGSSADKYLPKKEPYTLELSNDFKTQLYAYISKGRPEQALNELEAFTRNNTGPFQNGVLALSGRWQELSRKSRMGIISNEGAILERNQIVEALLELISG